METQAFFNAEAREDESEVCLGPNCPVSWYTSEDTIYDSTVVILKTHYLGQEEEWLFQTFSEMVHTYDPHRLKSCRHWLPAIPETDTAKAIVSTIAIFHNWLIDCIANTTSRQIRKLLLMRFDSTIPLRCAIEDHREEGSISDAKAIYLAEKYRPGNLIDIPCEGNILDVINDLMQCTYWNETKIKFTPIVHLCCKALPQRCQVRNLREIISNYCIQTTKVYMFMYKTLVCSLIGGYTPCNFEMDCKTRVKVLRKLWYNPPSRGQMQAWVFSTYQNLLFYIIKEHLVYSMGCIPSLCEVVKRTYKWADFETSVIGAMDEVRKLVQSNTEKSNNIMGWLEGVENILSLTSKSQLQNLFRAQRQTFAQAIVATCNRQDEQRNEVDVYQQFDRNHRKIIRDMAKRCQDIPTCIRWLTYFGVQTSTVEALLNSEKHYSSNSIRNDLRKTLKSISRYEFEAIRCLFTIVQQTHHDIRVFTLPKHYAEPQVKALRKRYGIMDNEEFPDYLGKVYACINCQSFKAFVSKDPNKNVRQATGHQKIVVDDETLKVYCGNRKTSNSSKKKKKKQTTDSRTAKRVWKNKRKEMSSVVCENTECLYMDMVGKLIQFHGELFLFCPMCGLPAKYTHAGHGESMWRCAMCISEEKGECDGGTITCDICEMVRDKWEAIEVAGDKQFIAVCSTCERPWMKDSRQLMTMKYTKKQIKEKLAAERGSQSSGASLGMDEAVV